MRYTITGMKNEIISSQQNRMVKQAASLVVKKHRLKEKLFLAEGFNPVEEANKAGNIERIFLDESKAISLENDLRMKSVLRANSDKVYIITDNVFRKITTTENSQGIIAVCALPKYSLDVDELNEWQPEGNLVIILENISDPGNCGTITRISRGMDAGEVLFCGDSADPYGPKVIRASAGVALKTKIRQCRETEEVLNVLRERGYMIVASDASGSVSLGDYKFPEKTALVLGGEARGISPSTRLFADELVSIPIADDVESFNVALSAAIFLYEYKKQKS
jgi:TrmH family RNA methyltransferase